MCSHVYAMQRPLALGPSPARLEAAALHVQDGALAAERARRRRGPYSRQN